MTSGGGRGNSKYKGPGAGTCQGVCEEELPGKRGGKSSKGVGTSRRAWQAESSYT